MATNTINLLPSTYNIQKGVNDAASTTKRIFIGGSFLLIFLATVCLLTVLFLTRQLTTQVARNNQLRANIADLEAVEQRYFLIKDRVDKIGKVFAARRLEPVVDQLAIFLTDLPENTTISAADITTENISVEFLVTSSESVVRLMSKIAASEQYSQVTLKNFQFNPTRGYLISFEMQQ